jgi:plasmid stabilization system protein ParE
MMRLIVDPGAQADIRAVFEHYEGRESGRGSQFETALDALFERLRRFPRSSPLVRPSIRRAIIHGYPYSVFYLDEDDSIFILAGPNDR